MNTYRKKQIIASIFCVAIGLGASMLSTLQAQTITNFSQYFDTDTVGQEPTGWGEDATGMAVVENSKSVSASNGLLFTADSGDLVYSPSLSPAISASNPNEEVQFSFDINPVQTNQSLQIWVANGGSGAPLTIIGFNADAQITSTTTGGSAVVIDPSYTAGLWYDVTMSYIPSESVYSIDVTQGNTIVGSLTGETFQTDTPFTQAYITGYGGAEAYFDNMQVLSDVTVPEPSTLTLLFGSLLGLTVILKRKHLQKSV